MRECFYPASRPTLVPFGNDMIFKVGGFCDDGPQLNLEVYTICNDTWTRIDVKVYADFERSVENGFNYWANMGGVQLNDRNLMIFGGHDLNGRAKRQTFLVEINPEMDDCAPGKYKVTNVCKKLLPCEGACQVTQPVVKDGVMFTLLDTRRDYMITSDVMDVSAMVPVMFDGNSWRRLD